MSPELEKLVEKMRNHVMTPEEKFEQRVSFVYGQQDYDKPGKSKDEIRQMLADHTGYHVCPKCAARDFQMDDNISSIGVAKFDRATHPQGLSPRHALEKALADYDAVEKKPVHIIVMFGRDMEDGSSGTRYFQAGAYRHHAQMGLCLEAMHMMRESGSD